MKNDAIRKSCKEFLSGQFYDVDPDMRESLVDFVTKIHDAALEEAANNGVTEILEDILGRRGLRQEWERIDRDIRKEVVDTWRNIIRALKISHPGQVAGS